MISLGNGVGLSFSSSGIGGTRMRITATATYVVVRHRQSTGSGCAGPRTFTLSGGLGEHTTTPGFGCSPRALKAACGVSSVGLSCLRLCCGWGCSPQRGSAFDGVGDTFVPSPCDVAAAAGVAATTCAGRSRWGAARSAGLRLIHQMSRRRQGANTRACARASRPRCRMDCHIGPGAPDVHGQVYDVDRLLLGREELEQCDEK